MKQHRKINDIIQELISHPEYIHHELWTKTSVAGLVCSDYDLEESESIDTIKDVLSDEDYSDFEDWIYNCYEYTFSETSFDYSPDLDKRIQRAIKLEKLIQYEDEEIDDDEFSFI